MFNFREKNSFIVLSDLHGTIDAVTKVKKEYLKKYDKIFILGDATDKGNESLEVLLRIKDLQDKYPRRVVYIPGDHDLLLYNYCINNDSTAKRNLFNNGGETTIEEINIFKKVAPKEYEEFIKWLGTRPIQAKHTYNNKNYALAHAFFNDKLYKFNSEASLSTLAISNDALKNAISNVLCYRLGSIYNRNEIVGNDHEIVIGHTPIRNSSNQNVFFINNLGQRVKAHCVDAGLPNRTNMFIFDGGEQPYETEVTYSNEKSKSASSEATIAQEKVKKAKQNTKANQEYLFNTLILETLKRSSSLDECTNTVLNIMITEDYSIFKSDINLYRILANNLKSNDMYTTLGEYLTKRVNKGTSEKNLKILLKEYISEVVFERVYQVTSTKTNNAIEQILNVFRNKDYNYILDNNGEIKYLARKVGLKELSHVALNNGYKSIEAYLKRNLYVKFKDR